MSENSSENSSDKEYKTNVAYQKYILALNEKAAELEIQGKIQEAMEIRTKIVKMFEDKEK